MLLAEGERYLGASGNDGPGTVRLVCDKAFGGCDQIGRDFGPGMLGGGVFDVINCFIIVDCTASAGTMIFIFS